MSPFALSTPMALRDQHTTMMGAEVRPVVPQGQRVLTAPQHHLHSCFIAEYGQTWVCLSTSEPRGCFLPHEVSLEGVPTTGRLQRLLSSGAARDDIQWDLLFRALTAHSPCPHTPHNHRTDLNPSLPTSSALPGTKLVPRADGGGRSAVPWGKWGLSLGTPTRCLLPAAPVPACPAQSHVRRGVLGACHPPLGTSGAAAGPGWEPGAP